MINIAVIGFGLRARGVFGNLYDCDKSVRLVAVCDPRDREELKSEIKSIGQDESKTLFYDDADKMLDEVCPDGVLIGTRCSLHVEMALKVIKRKIPLFLEKPVATNSFDMDRLWNEWQKVKSPVVVSFPLRVTRLASEVKKIIDSGDVGEIQHAAAFNYVTYGGDYYHSWYRDETETGGLFLQKATHDFDYLNYLIGHKPISICATESKQIMKGSKPAGLKCEDCAEKDICREGPTRIVRDTEDFVHGPYCCFAEDTGNQDSGTAIIRYDNGMHAVYTQNFFVRNKLNARRGAILAGTKGVVEFDWNTEEIRYTNHYIPGWRTYNIKSTGNHSGGDFVLATEFIKVIKGGESTITLKDGIKSCVMCLTAKQSAEEGRFLPLSYDGVL